MMRDGEIPSFIIMAGKVVIALIFLTLLFFAVTLFKGKAEGVVNQSVDSVDAALESKITQYNRDNIKGADVLTAISTFSSSSDEIYIEVITNKGSATYIYPSKKIAVDERQSNSEILEALKKAKEKGNSAYISPKGTFSGTVVYDSDDDSIIVGLLFEQTN